MKATAAHEKAVLSVLMPIVRNTMPRIRKTMDTLRRLKFILYLTFTSLKSSNEPSNKSEDLLFNVISKKSSKYEFTI